MLAQNFRSATDLGITEPQKEALMKTLVLLETGKLVHVPVDDKLYLPTSGKTFTGHFSMHLWSREHDCGTIACIGGTAELIGDVWFSDIGRCNPALNNLFEPAAISVLEWKNITPAQAARALRSYLTTGDAKWHEAVA